MRNVLIGHTSPETAFLVEDYPYGFRLRCQSRVVSQTTNPKRPGTVWNKPKASTYTNLRVLFLDEEGHVQNAALTFYADASKIAEFEATYGAALTSERDQKELSLLKTVAARSAARSATVVS